MKTVTPNPTFAVVVPGSCRHGCGIPSHQFQYSFKVKADATLTTVTADLFSPILLLLRYFMVNSQSNNNVLALH